MGSIQACSLGGIDNGATANGDEGIRVMLSSKGNSLLETRIGGFNANLVINDIVYVVAIQRLNDSLERVELGNLVACTSKPADRRISIREHGFLGTSYISRDLRCCQCIQRPSWPSGCSGPYQFR